VSCHRLAAESDAHTTQMLAPDTGPVEQFRHRYHDLLADALSPGFCIDGSPPQAAQRASSGPTPSCSFVPPISMPRYCVEG